MAYNELRTLAFRFSPEYREKKFEHLFYTLSFPPQWKTQLMNLYSKYHKNNYQLPVKSLNKTLRALVPDLISIVSNAGKIRKTNDPVTWLYSSIPIDREVLRVILDAWVRTEFTKVPEDELQTVCQELSLEELNWQKRILNLAEWEQEPNGTARLTGDLYTVLPDFFANLLSKPGVTLCRGPEILRFRRCPLAPDKTGAELVSWPPQETENKSLWSVVIKLSVQTVPFQSFPAIHCDLGVRRWVTKTKSAGSGESSVALLTEVSWLKGLHQSNSFQIAPVKWQKNGDYFQLVWADRLAEILDKLQFQHPFPKAQDINISPETSLNLEGTPNAALIYNTRMKKKHEVGAGLWPGDRQPFAEQIREIFTPTLNFCELSERVQEYRPKKPSNPFFEKADKSGEVHARRWKLLSQSIDSQLTIEIRYQSSTIRDALIDAVCEHFDVSAKDLETPLKRGEMTLTVKKSLLGAIGTGLELDSEIKNFKERLHKAISKRIQEVGTVMIKPPQPAIIAALVELAGPGGFHENKDPKNALRLGFAAVNRITQFITPETENSSNLPHRARAALLDLFRQLGLQVEKRKSPLQGFPEPLNYLGLWIIKQEVKTRTHRTKLDLPVLVFMSSNRAEIKAAAPGIGWLPYPEVLLKVAQGKVKGYSYQNRSHIMMFAKEKIEEIIGVGTGDTLLLCDAKNIRSIWKWAANNNIQVDKLVFTEETPRNIREFPGLRVVRIRGGDETPQWYSQKDEEIGFSEGIFKIPGIERIFASVYGKPKQQRNYSHYRSKITESTSRSKQGKDSPYQASPQDSAWNPVFYELTAACMQPGDEPWQWAAVTHELRNFAIHYDEPTALPLPLHLAKQIEEYCLPLS